MEYLYDWYFPLCTFLSLALWLVELSSQQVQGLMTARLFSNVIKVFCEITSEIMSPFESSAKCTVE